MMKKIDTTEDFLAAMAEGPFAAKLVQKSDHIRPFTDAVYNFDCVLEDWNRLNEKLPRCRQLVAIVTIANPDGSGLRFFNITSRACFEFVCEKTEGMVEDYSTVTVRTWPLEMGAWVANCARAQFTPCFILSMKGWDNMWMIENSLQS